MTPFTWGMLLLSAILVLISHPTSPRYRKTERHCRASCGAASGATWHDMHDGRGPEERCGMQAVEPSAAGEHETPGAVDLVLYRAIVEQLPDAIVVADRAGLILVWNRAAASLFGFSATEAIGRSLDIIIPERFRAAHWEGFHRAAALRASGSDPRAARCLTRRRSVSHWRWMR